MSLQSIINFPLKEIDIYIPLPRDVSKNKIYLYDYGIIQKIKMPTPETYAIYINFDKNYSLQVIILYPSYITPRSIKTVETLIEERKNKNKKYSQKFVKIIKSILQQTNIQEIEIKKLSDETLSEIKEIIEIIAEETVKEQISRAETLFYYAYQLYTEAQDFINSYPEMFETVKYEDTKKYFSKCLDKINFYDFKSTDLSTYYNCIQTTEKINKLIQRNTITDEDIKSIIKENIDVAYHGSIIEEGKDVLLEIKTEIYEAVSSIKDYEKLLKSLIKDYDKRIYEFFFDIYKILLQKARKQLLYIIEKINEIREQKITIIEKAL
ncbi:MAG: hypothetical protein ACPLRZ_11600 [Thermovenabulum sp.]|uniref:hypothetical protein n=1 Tax=Thermovenabulum sp. TaxID=3100335 RepID=UPI003C79CF16